MSAHPKTIKQSSLGLRVVEPREVPEERRRRVAEAAYYRAERRGFESGHEEEDWLEAEREIDEDLDSPPPEAE